jgi:hypothetical protein
MRMRGTKLNGSASGRASSMRGQLSLQSLRLTRQSFRRLPGQAQGHAAAVAQVACLEDRGDPTRAQLPLDLIAPCQRCSKSGFERFHQSQPNVFPPGAP